MHDAAKVSASAIPAHVPVMSVLSPTSIPLSGDAPTVVETVVSLSAHVADPRGPAQAP